MRGELDDFLRRIAAGEVPLRRPAAVDDSLPRVEDHLHLVPELFLQVAGTTRRRSPHAEAELAPGEALLVPPRLLHETGMAGKDIAWACGLATPSRFIRNFRAHLGMTPKA